MQFPTTEGIPAAFTEHGGNLSEARRRYHNAPGPWIDLSTGISPWAYPAPALSTNAWTKLPDPASVTRLVAAARKAYGAERARHVIACPGTDMAIGVLPRLLDDKRDVAIVSPTYGMHERSWRAAGFSVRLVQDLDEIGAGEIGVVGNPNNPDGRLWSREALMATAGRCSGGGGFLIIDEAFADTLPGHSVLDAGSAPPGAIVLRSFGKFYGLPGLRLGFVVTDAQLGTPFNEVMGSWAVSSAAIEIGAAALADDAWRSQNITRLEGASGRLRASLLEAGLEILGGTNLFQLVQVSDIPASFEHFALHGILVRPLPHLGALRLGLPANDEAIWNRITSTLASL